MIPAPEHFDSLKDHLENSGVSVSTLQEALISYLAQNDYVVSEHFLIDPSGMPPTTDHQTFYYRQVITEFLEATGGSYE